MDSQGGGNVCFCPVNTPILYILMKICVPSDNIVVLSTLYIFAAPTQFCLTHIGATIFMQAVIFNISWHLLSLAKSRVLGTPYLSDLAFSLI